MYDKVRVKKSQIFEVRQDTSQKETKTEDWVGFCPVGAAQDPVGAAHPAIFGSGRFWTSDDCGLGPGAFGDCFYTVLADYLSLIIRLITYTFYTFHNTKKGGNTTDFLVF